jgi:molecular chaperone DnaK
MQKDAEAHAEDDRKAREAIETRNSADNLAYQCEKQIKDLGDKLDGATKASLESGITAVREALKGDDVDAIKKAQEDLQKKFQDASSELYKHAAASAEGAAASAGPAPEASASQPKDADVVDAEFEMVDEDKKK